MEKVLLATALLLCVTPGMDAGESDLYVFESPAQVRPQGRIDELVFARLSTLNIQPALCCDAVFVRRVFLDVIGTLPTAEETRHFIDDPNTMLKRQALIDRLLERAEFADYWSMKWGDILRIKAEFPVNLWPNAAQAYHRWVRTSLAQNKPYDQFVRELLTSSGSNFRVGPVNFFRAIQSRTPEGIAHAVALTFMGARAENWPPDRLSGMAVFFSQIGYKPTSEWKEEIVFWDPLNTTAIPGTSVPGTAQAGISAVSAADEPLPTLALSLDSGPVSAVFPDGQAVQLPSDQDPRQVFADWFISPKNPWFAASVVNRVWAWLLGRGLIHPPDDFREDNPPSNPELLAFLEREFVASGYDLKHLYRLILTSATYQFSSVPQASLSMSQRATAAASFASYPLRRLEAEVLIDAINQITGTSDLYTSPIPEPFTYIPRDMPAVCIADGSITSPFLALFGRSARATGMENERANKLGRPQWLHLLNSGHIQTKLEQGPKLKEILQARRQEKAIVEELYLTILSRRPTTEELRDLQEYGTAGARKNRNDRLDIAWSLINSMEFLFRH